MKHTKNTIMIIAIFSLWSCFSQNKKEFQAVKHVVVIGFDGLSPNGIENANTPNFHKLMKEGASTMHARAALPSSSSTNWATMIMGAGPEQHGITSNDWEKNNFVLPTVVQGEDFLFPTIFKLIHDQKKNAEIGAIYHWSGFGRLFEKSAVNYDINPETEDETALKASNYIQSKQPVFTFVHFDHVDHAGHEYGHGSPEYYKSVEKADVLLGEVLQAIASSAMANETVVIVSADHGGLGKGHGGESLQEVEIPFIVWGKSVKKNYTIEFPVYQYDNAATVAFALGLKMPMACIGRPVKNAFEGYSEKDHYPLTKRVKQPVIKPQAVLSKRAGGLFTSQADVIIENPGGEGEIRYTTDGAMPTGKSQLYQAPFKTAKNTVVKSAIFKNGSIASLVSEAFFRVVPAGFQPPVSYEIFYLSNLNSIPFLDNLTPDDKGNCFEIGSEEINEKIKDNTVVRFKTTITIEKEGTYKFYTRSDDGSILKLNNETVANNDGDHGIIEKSGEVKLKPGKYPLEVLWFNGGGGGWLDVYYETAGMPKQIIPSSIFKL